MATLIDSAGPLVAFVGAGASALPPSFLPTWNTFNDLLLECLCDRLAAYSRNRQPTDEMLAAFRGRRDAGRSFAPDFQAQLIEEEIGADYFRVWQSLDTDVYGPVHAGLAQLAARGRLAAVVTLNFDRLIETALAAAGRQCEVFYDEATFAALPAALDGAAPPGESAQRGAARPLPVIKLHGSIEDATSLVDTLRQRVRGRPAGVAQALSLLLRRHPWLFLGFSGADWSYDPHYLGVLDAAPEARGFVFLAREGTTLEKGVETVRDAYGPGKASVVFGDLTTWLQEAFKLPPPDLPPATEDKDAVHRRVRERIGQWVDELGPMSVVNVVCAMLKSAGHEADSYWLLRKTWKSYRSPDETSGPAYARYNYNYGMSLLAAGSIHNPVALAPDMGNLPEWKKHADQNAFEFFARAYKSGALPAAGARLASVMAYRGDVGRAAGLLSDLTDEAVARQRPLEFCDVALASVPVYDIVQLFRPSAAQLRHCMGLAKAAGDEPRRALLCAYLGRLLTYSGEFGEADAFLKEAEAVVGRLDLPAARLATRAARGLWLCDSGTSAESAVRALRALADELAAADAVPLVTTVDVTQPNSAPDVIRGRNPERCRVLLDLNRSAMIFGDGGCMNRSLDELDELTADPFLGYYPHYCIAYAQCLLTHGGAPSSERVKELLTRARLVGGESKNPWVAQAVAHVAEHAGITLPRQP